MTSKGPFDFGEMMKMFNPEQINKLFDPEQMKKAMAKFHAPGLDVQAMMDSNRRNYEAMLTANKAAADAYKDFYERQMSIFSELMEGAKTHVASLGNLPDADAAKKQSEIYSAAAEKAFNNMAALAEATKNASQDAFAVIENRVKESIEELKKM